ncbi:MAG: rod shape-determining protein MreC [Litorivicinaceae bacterium]|mgnify:CR=1 FL=1|jgi:rod shape-determining protein MreC|nr:rod shape-determining protein MreC [Litorivicinaceae bacterium]MDP5328497.1 rod shape-determining protein MreC [Litorivicinaceae bacterium]MDP5330444.1 rod shape-determining protein MreC [Litorivicinaceae bacterium]MDP5341043.1 rod shape-determining protein MreC [Litorivicinaceae bacterium]MDP5342076.1 rod shape-determining protein MreC [Litorivicinaceae bacterium]
MRPLFSQSSVAAVRLAIALVTAFAMMVLDVGVGALNDVRLVVKTLLVPIEAIASAPVGMFDWAQEVTRSRSSLELDREQLQLENERLRIEQLELQSLQAENAELRRLLDVSQRQPARLLQGQVQSISTDPFIHQVTISRGSNAGVEEGFPVLSAEGLVGQVIAVYPHAADVLLISDGRHQIPIQVQRSRIRGIARGIGRWDQLEMVNLPETADIQVGDILETSGLGGRYPQGIPVARVTGVTQLSGQPFARVIAEPLSALNRLNLVMISLDSEAP